MDPWGATTAFTLADTLVPREGCARRILQKAVCITVGMPVDARDEQAFFNLLTQALETAHQVLTDEVLPGESKGDYLTSDRDDLPSVATVVASSGYHAKWFWLTAVRFASYLSSDDSERMVVRQAFAEMVDWRDGRAELSGDARSDVLSVISKNLCVKLGQAYSDTTSLVAA